MKKLCLSLQFLFVRLNQGTLLNNSSMSHGISTETVQFETAVSHNTCTQPSFDIPIDQTLKKSNPSSVRIKSSAKAALLCLVTMNCNLFVYPIGVFILYTYQENNPYLWIPISISFRILRQILKSIVAKSFMMIKRTEPWLSVGLVNVYYLVYLGLVFQQSKNYTPILYFVLTNAFYNYLEYRSLMKLKKL